MQSIISNLFKEPFNRDRWLNDQETLIKRLKKQDDEYLKEQAEILEKFQKAKQMSVVMVDIMRDRLARHQERINQTEKEEPAS